MMSSFGLAWVLEALVSFHYRVLLSLPSFFLPHRLPLQKSFPAPQQHPNLGRQCIRCSYASPTPREPSAEHMSVFQLMTLRGSVLEDAIPSTAKHSTARGLPLKEVLEHVIPELNVQCLRLAFNTPKVTEQLMKLDEQGVSLASGGRYSCCSD